jgi:hypothetical protein
MDRAQVGLIWRLLEERIESGTHAASIGVPIEYGKITGMLVSVIC